MDKGLIYRDKKKKLLRNKNVLVIGGSGSGKTRFYVKPNLMQMHSSYDDTLVRKIIQNVSVYDDHFVICFKSGIEMEV